MRSRALSGLLSIGFCLAGCSTTIFPEKTTTSLAVTVEREALVEAAAAVAETQWPEPKEESWGSRLAGFITGGDDAGRDGAVKAYLAAMPADAAPQTVIFDDAARQLRAAAALADATDAAAVSLRPRKDDVAVVETAIAKLRENRDIYLTALKAVDRSKGVVDENAVRMLKADFNDAIRMVGAAADRLADSVAKQGDKTFFAEPAVLPEQGSKFAGSF